MPDPIIACRDFWKLYGDDAAELLISTGGAVRRERVISELFGAIG